MLVAIGVMLGRAGLVLAVALAGAAPASAAVAPGRVTFPFSPEQTVVFDNPELGAPSTGVALPDGGAVLAGIDRGRGVVLVQLRADGTLDPRFGDGGISNLTAPYDPRLMGAVPYQLLRRPDGRLLLVYEGPPSPPFAELPPLLVAGVTGDGRVDVSYGDHGYADPGIKNACERCQVAALSSDDSLVLTGFTDQTWVVARLTPAGTLDRSFAEGGIAAVARGGASGRTVSLFADGGVAALASGGRGYLLTRLTTSGATDPAFHGGTPLDVLGSFYVPGLLARADGTIDVLVSGPASAELRRYTRAGELDGSFGERGAVSAPGGAEPGSLLLAAPDGTELVTAIEQVPPAVRAVVLGVTRVAAGGAVLKRRRIAIAFGGGWASSFAIDGPPTVTPLDQTGYRPGRPLVRSDGAILIPGGVGVIEPFGEGEYLMHDEEAAALLGPDLELDRSFGGPAAPARIAIRVPAQRAADALRLDAPGVAVTATTSGPGLARLRVRAGHRTIARSTAPVFAGGRQRLRALLTVTGRRYLRHAHHLRVRVTATFRDLVGEKAIGKARGTLR